VPGDHPAEVSVDVTEDVSVRLQHLEEVAVAVGARPHLLEVRVPHRGIAREHQGAFGRGHREPLDAEGVAPPAEMQPDARRDLEVAVDEAYPAVGGGSQLPDQPRLDRAPDPASVPERAEEVWQRQGLPPAPQRGALETDP